MIKHVCPRCKLETPRVLKFEEEFICQLCYVHIPIEKRNRAVLQEEKVI